MAERTPSPGASAPGGCPSSQPLSVARAFPGSTPQKQAPSSFWGVLGPPLSQGFLGCSPAPANTVQGNPGLPTHGQHHLVSLVRTTEDTVPGMADGAGGARSQAAPGGGPRAHSKLAETQPKSWGRAPGTLLPASPDPWALGAPGWWLCHPSLLPPHVSSFLCPLLCVLSHEDTCQCT